MGCWRSQRNNNLTLKHRHQHIVEQIPARRGAGARLALGPIGDLRGAEAVARLQPQILRP
jgi:hypothetical protein